MKARVAVRIAAAGLLVVTAVLIFCICGEAAADDGRQEFYDNISSILEGLDLSALDEYLKSHGNGLLASLGDTAKDIVNYLVHGNTGINFNSYIGELFSVLLGDVRSLLPAFAQIAALCMLSAVAGSTEGGLMSSSTVKIVRTVCCVLIITLLSAMLAGIIATAADCIDGVRAQIEIITPILITLTVMTGGSGAGAIYRPSALFISGGAVEMVGGIVIPAASAVILINFISKLAPGLSFSGTAVLIKNILKWAMGITLAVFSIFITVQSTAASLFDGIFFKATKYLVGSSVPIVGNFLSSGVDMIVAAGSVIRSSVGIVGIILLVAEVAPPIIMLIAFSLILKLMAAIVQPLGENTLCSLFSDLASDIEYIMAGVCVVAFLYALIVMLIISSAVNFI